MKINEYAFSVEVDLDVITKVESDLDTIVMKFAPIQSTRTFDIKYNGDTIATGIITPKNFSIFICATKVSFGHQDITFRQAMSKALLKLKFKRNELIYEIERMDNIIDPYEKHYGEVLIDETL